MKESKVLAIYVFDTVTSFSLAFIGKLVLPFAIGVAGVSIYIYAIYGIICGALLVFVENPKYIKSVFHRKDILGYISASIILTLVAGLLPFAAGCVMFDRGY